mgnify:CR=1 FL=1
MSCNKTFANHPKQTTQFKEGDKTDANERICELLDMIVEERVKTEDYNYVVEALTAIISPTAA